MMRIDEHFWSPAHSHELSEDDLWKIIDIVKEENLFRSPVLYFCCDCLEPIADNDRRCRCSLCTKQWHLRCIPASPDDIHHPFHSYHPLKLLIDVPPHNSKRECDACQEELQSYFYHCSMCDFSMHVRCSKDPPPPIVETAKCHEHTLTCMVRNDTFTCNACVHSKCATRVDVWDGEELEGVAEEDIDVSPFKVIEEGISIEHFSHEHILYKIEDEDDIDIQRDGSIRCEACVHPIFSEKHYKCVECDFIIHETCANLPLRKRHWLSTKPFYLNANKDDITKSLFRCGACETTSNGFRYESDEGHVLRCTEPECDFSLCLACATLPKKIKRKGDEHFLFLRHGEKANGKYWCEVCETVLDPHEEWFYTCHVSGVTFHIKCVVGEFPNAKPGFTYHYQSVLGETPSLIYSRVYVSSDYGEEIIHLVPNDRVTRPKCASCGSRCLPPLILRLFLVDTYEVSPHGLSSCIGSLSLLWWAVGSGGGLPLAGFVFRQ
ncbi:hypothetical protein Bca101_090243 [Brassica carinata]